MLLVCLQCRATTETSDAQLAGQWMEGAEPMPCGHSEADFLPNPPLAQVLPLVAARPRPPRPEH